MTTSFNGDDNANRQSEPKSEQGNFSASNSGDDNRQSSSTDRPSIDEQIAKMNKRIQDKDEFIDTLKSERQRDREQMEQMQRMLREFEEKLGKQSSISEVIEGLKNQQSRQTDSTSQFDPEELVERVKKETLSAVENKQLQSVYAANFQENARLVQEVYGKEQADAKIRQIAAENDLSFEDAIEMARSKPKAFRRLFVPEGTKARTPSSTGSINTAAFKGNQQEQTKKLYRDVNSEKGRMALVQEKFRELNQNN